MIVGLHDMACADLCGDNDAPHLYQHAKGVPGEGFERGKQLAMRTSVPVMPVADSWLRTVDAQRLTPCSTRYSEDVQCVGQAKAAGIQNILALRGDPPKGEQSFTAVEGGFSCALDLVKYIRQALREGCVMQAMANVQSRLALVWQKQPQQQRTVNDSG